MKKFKLVLWLIILALLALFFFQNKGFFMARHELAFKLPFLTPYTLPEMPNAILFLAFLLFGLLIAYFFSLLERFKLNKTIKNLNATVDSNLEMISALKGQLEAKTSGGAADSPKPGDVKEEIVQKQ